MEIRDNAALLKQGNYVISLREDHLGWRKHSRILCLVSYRVSNLIKPVKLGSTKWIWGLGLLLRAHPTEKCQANPREDKY